MKDYSAIKLEVKKHLAEGDIKKALDQLNTVIDNKHPGYDQLIMFLGRFNTLEKNKNTGTISESGLLLERAKLSEGLKLFTNHFDDPEFEEPLVRPNPFSPSSPKAGKPKKKKNKTEWLKLIVFLQVLILLGIVYIIYQLPA